MKKDEGKSDKKFAAVCGLYCEACSWFIATNEDPGRLKKLAVLHNCSEEEGKCYGCRSDKRTLYCEKCKMFACAAERGIDFCSECVEYPCDDLKQFQSAMPHRIELWASLERIKSIGYEKWLKEMRKDYTCPRCRSINTASSGTREFHSRALLELDVTVSRHPAPIVQP
jgi:hypothetical protein